MLWLKRSLSLLLFGVLIYFFWPMIGELRSAAGLLQHARWSWFLIAIPSGGASGAALRVRLLRRFGYAPEDSIFSLFVESISEIIALATVGLIGLAYLLQHGRISPANLAWSVLIVSGMTALTSGIYRLLLNPVKSQRLLERTICFWNARLGRWKMLGLEDLEKRRTGFHSSLSRYRQVPIWKFALAAYGKVILDVATLGAGFALFNYVVGPGTLFTGYGMILTFSGTAALPGGLGLTDASVPVIFSSLRTPAAVALVAGLTYRLISFWLVRFIGFFAWLYLEARPKVRVS